MSENTHWITVAAAAAELGVSESKVHELARNDRLRADWDGRTRKIDAASVLAHKKSRPVANMPTTAPVPAATPATAGHHAVPLFAYPPRRFLLHDDGALSAEGVTFADGTTVVHWTIPAVSTEVYPALHNLVDHIAAQDMTWIDQ